jgi:low affinity Fe/Cu permease
MKEWFHRLASKISYVTGTPFAFVFAVSLIIIWGINGPLFKYSNTWQLVINTTTTIVTFLMVFLIQNTQNRDAKAMHLKVDELIRASRSARDSFIDLEDISDDELSALDNDFKRLHDIEVSKVARLLHEKLAKEHARRKAHQTRQS